MPGVFRFDDFVLDCEALELHRGAQRVSVEPLVLDLLMLLLTRPGEVLSRDQLMQSVWKGRIVSDSTLSTAIKWARKALGDSGRDQRYIRTIRGRGIRFVAKIEAGPGTGDGIDCPRPDAVQPLILYVRALDSMGGRAPDPVTHALRARIGSVLARVPLLKIATAFAGADKAVDPRKLRSRYQLTHVLDVGVHRDQAMLAADVALTETRTGLLLWAQRFETPPGPADQEVLLYRIIRRIEPRIVQAMVTELNADADEADPGGLLLQAIASLTLTGWHQATFVEATRLLETAIAMAPRIALAHAYLALVKALGHRVGLLRDDARLVPAVISAAETALALDNQDSTILGLVGCALADVGQVDRALPILRKAIETGPQNGHARTAMGAALMMKQDYPAAAAHLAQGMALSPADSRLAVWGAALALAQLAQGELDSALASATDACGQDDRLYLPRLALAAVHLVRQEQALAEAAVRESLRTKPDLDRQETVCVLGERLGQGIWSIARSLSGRATAGQTPP
ncbi:MAG: winged helix-turn-helix domain-containing protein [Burkholderiaceae bacterium]